MSFDSIKPKRFIRASRRHYNNDTVFTPDNIEKTPSKKETSTKRIAASIFLFMFLQMIGPFYIPGAAAAGPTGPNLIVNGTFSSTSNLSYMDLGDPCGTQDWCINTTVSSPTSQVKLSSGRLLLDHETISSLNSTASVKYRAPMTPGKRYQLKMTYTSTAPAYVSGNYFTIFNGPDDVSPYLAYFNPTQNTTSKALSYTFTAESSYFSFANTDPSGGYSHSDFMVYLDNITLYEYDEIPPTISIPTVGSITGSSASVDWTTNETATAQIQYGLSDTTYGAYQAAGTGTTFSAPLSALADKTTYYYQIKANDSAGNISYKTGSFTTLDTVAPTWTSGYPVAAATTNATEIGLSANINETGKAYYGVYVDGATAPTVAQLKVGTNAIAGKFASIDLVANTTASVVVTGLTQNTPYDVYSIAEDSATNTQSAVVLKEVTTPNLPVLPDPSFSPVAGTFGTDQSVTLTSAGSSTIQYTTNGTSPVCGSGTSYSTPIPVTTAADTETTTTIKAIACSATPGSLANSAVASAAFKIDKQAPTIGSFANVVVTGLSARFDALTGGGNPISFLITETTSIPAVNAAWTATVSAYTTLTEGVKKIYAWAKDGAGNISSYSASSDLTFDATAPGWVGGYPKAEPQVVGGLYVEGSVKLSAKTTEDSTLYYGVYERGVAAPTNIEVAAGTGAIAGTSGTVEPVNATTEGVAVISGLESNTEYDVYFVAADKVQTPNLQAEVSKVYVKTIEATILPSPSMTPAPGLFNADQSVVLAGTVGSSIKYTVDGTTTPTCSVGTDYTGPINVTTTTTIKAVSCLTGYTESVVSSGDYNIDKVAPAVTTFTTGIVNGLTIAISALSGSGTPTSYLVTETNVAPDSDNPLWAATVTAYTTLVDGIKKIYAWAKDAAGNVSTSSASSDINFDSTPPAWAGGYPKVEPLTTGGVYYADRIVVKAKTNENSVVYYGVYANNATAPTITEVMDGTGVITGKFGSLSPVTSTTERTANILGLLPNTDYDVYFVAEDAAPTANIQGAVTKLEVKTLSSYSLAYNANGSTTGAIPSDVSLFTAASNATVLGNSGGLVKTGYNFGGWALNSAGTGTIYNVGDKILMNAPVTMYAKWITVSQSEFKDGDLTETKSGATMTFDKLPTLPLGQQAFNVSVLSSANTSNGLPQGKTLVMSYSLIPSNQLSGDYVATVTLDYPSTVKPLTTDTVMYWDTNSKTWSTSGINIVSRSDKSVTFTTNHFTEFGIFAANLTPGSGGVLPVTGISAILLARIALNLILAIGMVLVLARTSRRTKFGFVLN